MTAAAYGSGPISRRPRRSKAEMEALRDLLGAVVALGKPMTVRQVFYQMVARGAIAKTEAEYKGIVVRLLGEMRLSQRLPFEWLTDSTRWMHKSDSFTGAEQALRHWARAYRQDLWHDSDEYVEVWLEKEALAGVLVDVTYEYDVPLMVTRGYPSLSFLYAAAATIRHIDKPTFLYYFGDHDPSGTDISRNIEQRLRQFAPDSEITFERVAVTADQIEDLDLPTRPTKATDSRSGGFEGESVEVDAIPPDELRDIAEDCILEHVDVNRLRVLKVAEKSERDLLLELGRP